MEQACPAAWRTIFKKLRVPSKPKTRNRLFLLDLQPSDCEIAMSLILYGIRRTVHMARARGLRIPEGQLGSYLWEAVKLAAAQHKHTQTYIRKLWDH